MSDRALLSAAASTRVSPTIRTAANPIALSGTIDTAATTLGSIAVPITGIATAIAAPVVTTAIVAASPSVVGAIPTAAVSSAVTPSVATAVATTIAATVALGIGDVGTPQRGRQEGRHQIGGDESHQVETGEGVSRQVLSSLHAIGLREVSLPRNVGFSSNPLAKAYAPVSGSCSTGRDMTVLYKCRLRSMRSARAAPMRCFNLPQNQWPR